MLKSWWSALLDLVYPPRCPVCQRPVEAHGAWCPICLAPVLARHELNLAARRLAALASCAVLCDYTAGVKTLLHKLKFRGDTRAAVSLAWLLTERLAGRPRGAIEAVVPVPLHPDRLAERGYNQTELIFRPWCERQGWPWREALARTRPTDPQWELSPAERRRNVRGAFALASPETIRGKSVLLVDDIITTGATMNECAKVLKRGGAARVLGFALAGSPFPGR